MTVEIPENEQLIEKVLLILQKQLPPIDFLRFVATFNLGKGNYLAIASRAIARQTPKNHPWVP